MCIESSLMDKIMNVFIKQLKKEDGQMSHNTPEVPESKRQLNKLKWEVAEELQLDDDIQEKGFANMTTREVGQIGGNMVKKMITFAEQEMTEQGSDIID